MHRSRFALTAALALATAPYGAVWQVSPPTSAGAPWTLTILHELFATSYVEGPVFTPLLTKSGKIYGATDNFYTKKTGARTPAVIYQITP